MTRQKGLQIVSALILLYCTFTGLMALLGAVMNGISKAPIFITYVGLLMLAVSVNFVASYRQLFKQRPTLVIAAFCLIIISECLGVFLLRQALNDPFTQEAMKAINDSIREGLANGTIPKGQGFEEQIADIDLSWMTLIKSIVFYCVLFALPLYTNLRKVTSPS